MIVVYSPGYHIDIGTHVFPTRKYQLLFERIRMSHADAAFVEPHPASWEQLATVHTAEYLRKLQTGDFGVGELAQLEIPWSPAVVEGFRLMTGGTIEAAWLALETSRAFHIGGGFHHAFETHGEGFCLFNDVAVATRLLLAQGAIQRAAVIDLDVHHGNGTAFILGNEPAVFTLSMHQEHNYPAIKPPGSLDVGLLDGATDAVYLERLRRALPPVVQHAPDIVFYLAGADPFEDDQLGGLALTKQGLRERDRLVFDACAQAGFPVVILLAGGYARRLDDTVDIHYATFEEGLTRLTPGPTVAARTGTAKPASAQPPS
jgi:acetoin utilization deacetylase AcuC-like enzyme